MGILEERGEGKERVIGKMKEREKERGVALNGIHYYMYSGPPINTHMCKISQPGTLSCGSGRLS